VSARCLVNALKTGGEKRQNEEHNGELGHKSGASITQILSGRYVARSACRRSLDSQRLSFAGELLEPRQRSGPSSTHHDSTRYLE